MEDVSIGDVGTSTCSARPDAPLLALPEAPAQPAAALLPPTSVPVTQLAATSAIPQSPLAAAAVAVGGGAGHSAAGIQAGVLAAILRCGAHLGPKTHIPNIWHFCYFVWVGYARLAQQCMMHLKL